MGTDGRKHARISPSSLHRLIECPASLQYMGLPSPSSPAAAEGTAAHLLGETCLREGRDPVEFLGFTIDPREDEPFARKAPDNQVTFEVTQEMVHAVSQYIEVVRSEVEDASEFELETKLSMQHLHDDMWGTADTIVYKERERKLLVIDYKHGKRVSVDADANPQLLAYASGAAHRYHNRGVDTVEIVIVQPRDLENSEAVRRYQIDVVDLWMHEEEIREAIAAAEGPSPKANVGDWCRFCPGRTMCAAWIADNDANNAEAFDAVLGVAPDPDDVGRRLAKLDQMKAYIRTVEETAHAMAEGGRPPTGYKLVAKEGRRKWRDEEAAATELKSRLADTDIYERKMRSPAQIEKIVGKKNAAVLKDFVISESSGTKLVPVSDPSPAIRGTVADTFI